MQFSFPIPHPRLSTAQGRQRVVAAAIDFTQGTALAPQRYERALLDLFVRGFLTIDQVMERLALYGPAPKAT
jgi:TolB-like protein